MTKTRRVRIVADRDPIDPREWDCAGRMICWHSGYNLGDKHDYRDPVNFPEELACEADVDLEEELDRLKNDIWDRLYNRAHDANNSDPFNYAERLVSPRISTLIEKAVRDGYVILPLYLYDHSSITMRTGSFSCPWDSGQVGWIVCDNETIEKEFNGNRELAEKVLQAEVKVYDQYLTGDVYGYIVEETDDPDSDDWEVTDSCSGFYGSDIRENGMADHLGDELTALAEDAKIEY